MLHLLKGDWMKARSRIEHMLGVCRTGNAVFGITWAVAFSAWVLAELGEASAALDRLHEGELRLERLPPSGTVVFRSWAYHSLARACLVLGRLDDARRLAKRAIEFSSPEFAYTAHGLHLVGEIAIHPDRFDGDRGEPHYRKALGLAVARGMRPLVAHCHLGLGKLSRSRGKDQQAQEHVATATTMYREMDMRFYLEQAEAEQGRQ